ncbi:MAG TPA: hypothetical protein VGI99_03810 [Gemmataceae bacterium]|jgi:hypothetical protein
MALGRKEPTARVIVNCKSDGLRTQCFKREGEKNALPLLNALELGGIPVR